MIRVMFDSNAFDAVLKHDDAEKLRAAEIVPVVTSVQIDEIRQIADVTKRRRLFDLLHHLQAQRVASADLPIEAPRDAVIAVTAALHCDLLVSDDRHIAQGGLRILTYATFRTEFLG